MIGLGFVYTVAAIAFASYAAVSLAARRWINGGFWALLAVSFAAGDRIGDLGNGLLVLALVLLAAIGLGRPAAAATTLAERQKAAARAGNRLFGPALLIPAVALGGTFLIKALPALVDGKQATLVALTTGVLLALAVACAWLRPLPATVAGEGVRLMDAVGWAAVLPQMLAALGGLFALAGVGETMGGLLGALIPAGNLAITAIVYTGGMALLTMALGNAFAAFPVMMAAVGLPLLIQGHHGNPAAVAALGMLAGFCGTLLTPMAANFNVVPAALLELRDRHGVIRAQAPTALILWAANVMLLYLLAFR